MKQLIKKLTTRFILDAYHAIWPFLGAIVYGNSSEKLKVIGITGTNGKTSATHMTTHVLESAGFKVASVSTLRFKIADREWTNKLKMTMPGRMKLQKFMRDAVKAGCTHLVMEVTSEGIKQSRHKFIKFDTAVFTNLTKEHIESHGGFENYKKAKGRFFAEPHRVSVVNLDDANAEYFLNFPAEHKITYGINSKSSGKVEKEIIAVDAEINNNGIKFKVDDVQFALPLLGEFNVYNALAATGASMVQRVALEQCAKALKTFKGIPGRMEIVINEPFSVVVDYAHTPDALIKVYKTLISANPKSEYRNPKQIQNSNDKNYKLICVLGSAGGGRDKWKRPEFGKIAAEYCDEIILTDEDPYDENPSQILSEIESGISNFEFRISKILDRRKAIHKALELAKDGDTVVITGKGAEPLMMTKEGPVEWDDRKVVVEEFNNLNKNI
ncbi:MAG: UDP-N-acetylmuramoyl-L-alanyl-D-glutamate--2,6-diaminopimelate ligase [Candidatus Spechtbacterales bacterium]